MSLGVLTNTSRRVIAHVDLDCFYCQVEQKRLDIPRDVPCAVQQWQGIIAVNYAARAQGVTRHMRVHEAKKACPQLRLVHVKVIGADGQGLADEEAAAQHRSSAKACLQRYRLASGEIMRLLQRLAPKSALERASIDEAYLDLTSAAEAELAAVQASAAAAEEACGGHSEESSAGALGLVRAAADCSSVEGGGELDPGSEMDLLLAAGAVLVARLRAAVLSELAFTCSAGVSVNKLLAKLGSSRHKPNKQAIISPRAITPLMQARALQQTSFAVIVVNCGQ